MEALSVKLEAFDGPLDLLLHLIEKTSRKSRKIRWILVAFRDEIRHNKGAAKGF